MPLAASVMRPCASTVILALVYAPAVTAVLSKFTVSVEPATLVVKPVPPAMVIEPLRSLVTVPVSPPMETVASTMF